LAREGKQLDAARIAIDREVSHAMHKRLNAKALMAAMPKS